MGTIQQPVGSSDWTCLFAALTHTGTTKSSLRVRHPSTVLVRCSLTLVFNWEQLGSNIAVSVASQKLIYVPRHLISVGLFYQELFNGDAKKCTGNNNPFLAP